MTLNKVTLIGNVGKDPESRFTPGGDQVTSFSVAVNNKRKGKQGEELKETAWFRISAWGKLGEICNTYLKKGKQVYIEGKLMFDAATGGPRTWTAQDGSIKASFEIMLTSMEMLGSKSDSDGPSNAGAPEETATPEGDEGDLAF